ncbi:DNA-deoxyinosine glycosylase [Mycolicibacterium sediminis]|uniref:DNA-deoxyinosine glycosylase n=1 Tax=Mycolicibacterium sediminis TaxID=1286180 RepID=A0A7I7QXY0_9MYCO|nr:DNA-deoxyinosine glycosylase [Mycolicibacterium sediminis]BBY31191.1 DNA-deoxyinosine glycosylase [Mycolicibacterium sediminis]
MTESATPLREGLPPVVDDAARVLILGSFPSEQSLALRQYYANPRNQFWALLSAAFGFDADVPYDARIAAARHHGVALWDVVHSCRRAGSLDAKIDRRSIVANDVGALLATHRGIDRVFANGAAAEHMYERHVATPVTAVRLPSSSPAATMSFPNKLIRWRSVV